MKNHAQKFASVTLALSILWILFEHVMGFNTTRLSIGVYTNQVPVILFSLMVVLTVYYERRRLGYHLTFSEGFRAGLTMSVIFAAGYTILNILYFKFMNPGHYQAMKVYTVSLTPPDKMADALKEVDRIYGGSPVSYFWLFLFTLLWGVGMSALASAIFMKNARTA